MVALRVPAKKRAGKAIAQRSKKTGVQGDERSAPISNLNHPQNVIENIDLDRLTPDAVSRLQRTIGNRATTQLINRKTAESRSAQPITETGMSDSTTVQRVYNDDTYASLPYPTTHKPPDFEYWVNSMWAEVLDVEAKKNALALLKGGTDSPRAGGGIDNTDKKAALDVLYKNAYQEQAWTTAAKLIQEGSLSHEIQAPVGGATSTKTTTIAAGYHGTWRDPDTLIKAHKGTIPTIERHGKDSGDKAGIQEYMKTKLGIEEWHPFWFGGDITSRPMLFRNKQEDNELDTTISVAKSPKDSLDFPMIESMEEKDKKGFDEHGLPITENYVYLVGVTQGFGTTVNLQGENAFGEGEMATLGLNADDHLGYVRYRRVHAGGSRNDGYRYKAIFKDLLPGARKRNISKQVQAIVNGMPDEGINRTDESKFNFPAIYAELKNTGIARATSALTSKFPAVKKRTEWTNVQWQTEAEKLDPVKSAPTPKAKEIRIAKFIEGVRSKISPP